MGRSQESFNKLEKEKKRLKKQKDKARKKEERRSTSEKGRSLDDMIAYVDEDGNITSTPPDPAKKKNIKAEDIEIGISRQKDPGPKDSVRKGKVTFFNESKGYGFIKEEGSQESIFVHVNGLTEPIAEGDIVTFETEMGHKGINAVNVKPLK
jgi:cold shock CspA family protein